MSMLIIDSGSTKADWLFTDEGETRFFRTKGMNPFFRDADKLIVEIEEEVVSKTGRDVQEIYFYGAGVVEADSNPVKEILTMVFPDAVIETHSDIIAVCRALFGYNEGIACILGTGSNACRYDGKTITAQIPPLGYILGDECSGTDFGKQLLGDYFKRAMPEDLKIAFQKEFAPKLVDILQKTYREECPNRFLAGFTPFISRYIGHPYCLDMVKRSFRRFIERNVLPLLQNDDYRIGMVGSIAFCLQDILKEQLTEYGFDNSLILKDPMSGLKEYHKK